MPVNVCLFETFSVCVVMYAHCSITITNTMYCMHVVYVRATCVSPHILLNVFNPSSDIDFVDRREIEPKFTHNTSDRTACLWAFVARRHKRRKNTPNAVVIARSRISCLLPLQIIISTSSWKRFLSPPPPQTELDRCSWVG